MIGRDHRIAAPHIEAEVKLAPTLSEPVSSAIRSELRPAMPFPRVNGAVLRGLSPSGRHPPLPAKNLAAGTRPHACQKPRASVSAFPGAAASLGSGTALDSAAQEPRDGSTLPCLAFMNARQGLGQQRVEPGARAQGAR